MSLPISWRELVAEVNGQTLFGQRGVRDPDAPCEAFIPGKPEPRAQCSTDGHYMCDECTERKTCDGGCGQRPSHCDCPGGPFYAWRDKTRDLARAARRAASTQPTADGGEKEE